MKTSSQLISRRFAQLRTNVRSQNRCFLNCYCSCSRLSSHGLAILMALLPASARAAVLYVDLNSPTPMPPYTNWATASHVIQDAVDAAAPGDTVLVTNGVYA